MVGEEGFEPTKALPANLQSAAISNSATLPYCVVLPATVSHIFSVRASNDFSKIGTAYIFAIIDLIASVVSVILSFVGTMNFSSLLGGVAGVAFSACIFWAAKTIKDNA